MAINHITQQLAPTLLLPLKSKSNNNKTQQNALTLSPIQVRTWTNAYRRKEFYSVQLNESEEKAKAEREIQL